MITKEQQELKGNPEETLQEAGIVKFNAVEERIITLRDEKMLLDSDKAVTSSVTFYGMICGFLPLKQSRKLILPCSKSHAPSRKQAKHRQTHKQAHKVVTFANNNLRLPYDGEYSISSKKQRLCLLKLNPYNIF
ncbi:MAG: hypothetical protein LBD52_08865 [Prevotellaceae bacterium]|jgi:hypothetical protein|nr:hypothetical protein [Prevotellaceae bacterium]